MRTFVKTIRFTKPLSDQLSKEAERLNVTNSDIVRSAISEYFERRQAEAVILALEQRINAKIEANGRLIDAGLRQILSLAQPA